VKRERLLIVSQRWFHMLQRFYPPDFRDNMGAAVVEAYRDRAREALQHGGAARLAILWVRALADAVRNGLGERARPAVAWRRAGNWGRDAELATRRLARNPALVIAVVATLSIGLGLFGVVYTVVQTVLIDPMPYKAPRDLYFVWRDYRAFFDLSRGWLGGTDVAALQKAGGVIEDASAIQRQLITLSTGDGSDPSEVSVAVTSPNLFDLLGVQPAIGRGFAPHEVGPKRPPVIVLTHALWNRLGGDRGIVNQTVRLNGEPYTVIGVMPPAFAFVRNASLGPPQPADAYITLSVDLATTNPSAGSFAGLVRAKHGTPPETVNAAIGAVGRLVDARDFKGRGLKLYSVGLKEDLVAGLRPALIVLGFAGALLVLVLMVNLASVLLARAAQREHEFAVSRALGANTAAVARATLFEGALLGLGGGCVAALAAIWGTRTLVALAPLELPRREAVAVDWRIASVMIGLGVVLGLVAAVAPAAWAARANLSSLLASSAVRGGGGHGRLRRAMVVAQVALSLVLLSTGGLVVRSLDHMLRADPGFVPDGLLTFRLPMPAQIIPKAEDALALQARVEQTLGSLAGVTGVSATSVLPLSAGASQTTISIPGAPGNTGKAEQDAPLTDSIGIRAGYVGVMGMRVIEGRAFEVMRRDGVREALFDRRLARQFFPSGGATGARIPYGEKQSVTVVGVVDQARLYDVHQDGRPQIMVRAEDWGFRTMTFVLRTRRDPATLTADVRAAIRGLDPRLAIANVRTMDEVVDDALRRPRISAALLSGFALGALLLAAMGLVGVISSSVTRRRHELAVRLAVGANHNGLLRLVLGEGVTLVGVGALIGVPAIYGAGQVLRGALVGVSPLDPLTLVAVGVTLAVVTVTACYLPARRVLRIDPAQSLRQD